MQTKNEKKSQVLQILKQEKIDYILAQYVDIHGVAKAKGVPISHYDDLVEVGAGFAGAAIWGLGQGPHDPDFFALPDLDTLTILPWEDGVVRFACDVHVNGKPWPYCSRLTLKKVIAEAREMGYVFNVGIEPEHFLVVKREDGSIAPADPTDRLSKPCYDVKGLCNSMAYLRTMIKYMEQVGWDVLQSDHEDANGQFEINFRYVDALRCADNYVFFKIMATEVAKSLGAIATFMPKPFSDRTGSGAHLHFHLADAKTGQNLFLDEKDRRGLGQSQLAYHFLGGLLKHAKGMTAAFSPSVNSYKRLVITGSRSGFTWVPAFISYGGNNRTQMFRTPDPGRFECRTVDAGCNPYLALAVFLKCGLDGIKNEIDPGEPIHENMYEKTPEEIKALGIEIVPQSLYEALLYFQKDEVVQQALGKELSEEFLKLKQREWTEYHSVVTPWEIERYLEFF